MCISPAGSPREMHFVVQPGADQPIYRQLVQQVLDGVVSGRIVGGERLPSHRELAQQLVIAPLTVKKAYDELEKAGVIHTLRGRGTFVSERSSATSSEAKVKRMTGSVRRVLSDAAACGMPLTEVVRLLRSEAKHQEEDDS